MKIGMIALLFLFVVSPISASRDDKIALSKEILALTNINQMMDQIKIQTRQIQKQVMDHIAIPEGKDHHFHKFQNRVNDRIFEIMNYENMENDYIDLYSTTYTMPELKGIVGFYRSPIGKSMLEKQPILIKKSMEMTQRKLEILIPELQKMSEEFERSLKNQVD